MHRNVFQGRRPAAATASCAANNARTSRTPRPCHWPPRAARGQGRGQISWPWWVSWHTRHGRTGTATPAAPAHWMPREQDTLTPSLCMLGCWGWGAGLRAASVAPGCCLGHSWPRGPGLARRAGRRSSVVRQNTELHFHLNSGNGAHGAVTAASAIWCWRGSARPGGQPGGGCFALSRGCPAAEHIKAPGRPRPAGTTQGTAGQAAEGLPVLLRWGNGVQLAPQKRQHPAPHSGTQGWEAARTPQVRLGPHQ